MAPKITETPKKQVELTPVANPVPELEIVPKTPADYDKLEEKIKLEVAKAFQDSKSVPAYVRSTYKFNDLAPTPYLKTIMLTIEVGYSYRSRNDKTEIGQVIAERYKLKPGEYTADKFGIEFVYEKTRVKIENVSGRLYEGGVYVDSNYIFALYGYDGEFLKVINILYKPFGYELHNSTMLYYNLRNGDDVYKEYKINSGTEVMCKMLGTNYRNIYSFFRTKKAMLDWLMASRYIGKSSFFIDEENKYVGPADYFGSTLFADLVHLAQTHYNGAGQRHTPETTLETAKKYQFKYWADINSPTLNAMNHDKNNFRTFQMISEKYSESIIQEVTGIKTKTQLLKFKNEFENQIDDFDFFILSSSQETIREKLASFNQTRRA